jgi:hypothetical protein
MAYRNVRNDLPQRTSTDAECRAFVQALHDAFLAMGLVQTADTGQINPATVSKPGGLDTVAGYEIWRFADAHQGSAPIFFKIEYGTGSGVDRPAVWLQVSSGSNGTGSLTGAPSQRRQGRTTGAVAANHLHFFSGELDRFTIAWAFYNPSSPPGVVSSVFFISVEREVNSLGARIAGGAYISWYDSNQGHFQEYWTGLTGGAGLEEDFGILAPRVGNGADGANVSVYPQYHVHNTFKPAGLNQMGYLVPAMPVNVPLVIPVYGANHEYYPLGLGFGGTNTITSLAKGGPTPGGSNTGVSLLCRYDA